MTLMLVTLAGVLVAALVYWFPVRRFYQRSEARRLNATRAMSGDAESLAPDYDATIAITMDATPAAVWGALLQFGWPRNGRPSYEWLGRVFGFLDRRVSATPDTLVLSGERPRAIALGQNSEIPVKTIDPARTLVLGRETDGRWWTWQFEVSTLDERRTRLILRDRARARAALGARAFLTIRKGVSFVLTRKMLLDIKRAAESTSDHQSHASPRVA